MDFWTEAQAAAFGAGTPPITEAPQSSCDWEPGRPVIDLSKVGPLLSVLKPVLTEYAQWLKLFKDDDESPAEDLMFAEDFRQAVEARFLAVMHKIEGMDLDAAPAPPARKSRR